MSQGKYSPYCTGKFTFDRWSEGSEGRVEVDAAGFDRYGYDANGKDIAGYTEDEYMFMDPDEYLDRAMGVE